MDGETEEAQAEPMVIGLTEEQAEAEGMQRCREDPNCTITYDKHREIMGDQEIVRTETTILQVNDDGTETEIVTEKLEIFNDGVSTNSLERVVSNETRPTETPFVSEEEPEEVSLPEPI